MGYPSITEIRSFTRVISAAELLAFAGGAIPVVPAPGGGQIVWPLSLMYVYNFNGVAFSSTPQLDLRIHGNTDSYLPLGLTLPPTATASVAIMTPLGLTVSGFEFTSVLENQGIDLVLTAGAFALAGIGTASVTAGGTGYAPGDTGTITTGNGDATYRVLTVSGLGAVLTFAITFPGSGYATGAGQATATGGAQPGVGINFTVDVTSIVDGDGTIKVTTLYQVIDVP